MPTQFLQIGNIVAGTKYKLAGYTEKHDTDKYGTSIDVSELTLEQVDTHDQVTLVKEKARHLPRIGRELPLYLGGIRADLRREKRSGIFIATADGDQI